MMNAERSEQHDFEQAAMIRAWLNAKIDRRLEGVDSAVVELPQDTAGVFKTVRLRTGLFEARALPLYLMPGVSVLEIMLMPYEPMKMAKMIELLTTALESDKDIEMLKLLSMHELGRVLNQWVDKSSESEAELEEEEAEHGRNR